jgi:cytochrome b6-f complex iron-sulfur subunit
MDRRDTHMPDEPPPASAPTDAPPSLDRRRFLNDAWKALGAALLVEAGWTSYDILNPSTAEGFGGEVDAGSLSDFLEEGTVKYFLDGRFYVTQHQGGLRALYQKCPHLGCRVPFCQSSARFECPCHGSVYNIIGEYVGGPAPRGMDRFPIRIHNGRVAVDTSSVVEGPPRGVLTGPREASGPSCKGEASAGTGGAAS